MEVLKLDLNCIKKTYKKRPCDSHKGTHGHALLIAGSTGLLVKGNARVTGILTVGTYSITLDGTTSVVTADAFIGDGSGLTGVGVGSSDSINTTGIVTASRPRPLA